MSAYLVSNKEIFLLAAVANSKKYDFPMLNSTHGESIRFYVKDLIKENLASVNERYKEQQEWEPNFKLWLNEDGTYDEWKLVDHCLFLMRCYTPIEVIKLAHHYSYQACDSLTWLSSDAKYIIDRVIELMIPELDGYEEAAWGIS